ncbi:hypothetical protein [Actinopolyspora mzabensis]|nr:hypothetical protein [Actinopolyspora mzabensis]
MAGIDGGIGNHFELLGDPTPAVFMALWVGAALWWKLSGPKPHEAVRAQQ